MKLKDLLKIAEDELSDLSTVSNPDFRLEQAVKTDSGWEIVVSFLVENPNKPSNPFSTLSPAFQFERIYKKVSINSEGEVAGLFIYNNN